MKPSVPGRASALSSSRVWLGALASTALLAACSTSSEPIEASGAAESVQAQAEYPVTVANCGNDLTIESEPETILSIGTSAVSLLDAAGASDRIVARAGEFGADLPAGLETPPTEAPIIDSADPAIEVIVGTEADIIVGYGLFNASPEDVAATGLQNIVIDGECSHDAGLAGATDFEAIFSDVERLASVFGTTDAAEANLTDLRAELDELTAAATSTGDGEQAAVVYYFSEDATMSARGGLGIANDVLARAGFENVYGDEASVYMEANIETLLDADPHTVVVAYGLYGESFEDARANFESEPGVAELTAVQEGRVVGVPASDLAPDPGAIQGLRTVLEGTGAL